MNRTLRVAHLMSGFPLGGLEQLVLDLATEGLRHGIEPLVIGIGPDGPMRAAFVERGIRTLVLGDVPGMRVACLSGIHAALEQFGADVLHAHDLGPWLNAAAARLLRPSTAVIATIHEMVRPSRARRPAAMLASLTALTDALVACGTEVEREIRKWAPAWSRLVTIGNGVRLPSATRPEDRARAREYLGIPADARAIGYIGRFTQVKGPDLLLESFLEQFGADPTVHLAMVGAGDMEDALRERARGFANVHFPGMVIGASSLLAAFDVYAQTSRSEGRSLAMLEAMAAGLPTVAHDLPGVREIHRDDATALLTPLEDLRALGVALAKLVRDPGLCARLGTTARIESERYSLDATFAAYEALYREVARGPRTPRRPRRFARRFMPQRLAA